MAPVPTTNNRLMRADSPKPELNLLGQSPETLVLIFERLHDFTTLASTVVTCPFLAKIFRHNGRQIFHAIFVNIRGRIKASLTEIFSQLALAIYHHLMPKSYTETALRAVWPLFDCQQNYDLFLTLVRATVWSSRYKELSETTTEALKRIFRHVQQNDHQQWTLEQLLTSEITRLDCMCNRICIQSGKWSVSVETNSGPDGFEVYVLPWHGSGVQYHYRYRFRIEFAR
jgi:hypothetical protein